MLYIMPDSLWDEYKSDPAKLLRHTKEALKERYPKTDITYDTLVVVLNFKNYKFESTLKSRQVNKIFENYLAKFLHMS